MITIVLADDHKIVRQGVRLLLEEELDFRVVGEAANGLEAAQLVESLHPDVLVVDMTMAPLNGIEVTRRVRSNSAKTQVVVLSMHGDDCYVSAALETGAIGYVLKEDSPSDLVKAIREAHRGRQFLSPPLAKAHQAAQVLSLNSYLHPVADDID